MTLSDVIEAHLRDLLTYRPQVEVQRNELSDRFACAPSQINYVLMTRFTVERGYVVESRRGEGGYIRIRRMAVPSLPDVLSIFQALGPTLTQREAGAFVDRLEEAKIVPAPMAAVLRRAADRKVLGIELPERDRLRQRLMKGMLAAFLAESGGTQR